MQESKIFYVISPENFMVYASGIGFAILLIIYIRMRINDPFKGEKTDSK
jgi:hypothetical protein